MNAKRFVFIKIPRIEHIINARQHSIAKAPSVKEFVDLKAWKNQEAWKEFALFWKFEEDNFCFFF